MANIREATPDDLPAMLDMAERFIAIAWSRVGVPYDAETCRDLLNGLIDNEAGILLVDDECRAMIGVMVHPWHFNRNVLTATELFWWAEPGSRAAMRLKREAESRVQALGVPTLNMASQHHLRSEGLERFYLRDGYEPSEHIFIKVFG